MSRKKRNRYRLDQFRYRGPSRLQRWEHLATVTDIRDEDLIAATAAHLVSYFIRDSEEIPSFVMSA